MDTNEKVKEEIRARVKGSTTLSRGEMSALVADLQSKFQKRASDSLVAFGMGLQRGGAGGDKDASGTFVDRVTDALEQYDKSISKITEYLRLGRRGGVLDDGFRTSKVDLWLQNAEQDIFRAAFGGGGYYEYEGEGDDTSFGLTSYGETSYLDSHDSGSRPKRRSHKGHRHEGSEHRGKKDPKKAKEEARKKAKNLADKLRAVKEKARMVLDKKMVDAALLVGKKVAKRHPREEATILARQGKAYNIPPEVADAWLAVVQKYARAHRKYA